MRIGLLYSFFIGLIAFLASDCPAVHETQSAQNKMNALISTLQRLNLRASTKYVTAFHDLDGNGVLDAIVYLMEPSVCGSGGCNTVILSYNHGWSKVSTIHLTRPPIVVMGKNPMYGIRLA